MNKLKSFGLETENKKEKIMNERWGHNTTSLTEIKRIIKEYYE